VGVPILAPAVLVVPVSRIEAAAKTDRRERVIARKQARDPNRAA